MSDVITRGLELYNRYEVAKKEYELLRDSFALAHARLLEAERDYKNHVSHKSHSLHRGHSCSHL